MRAHVQTADINPRLCREVVGWRGRLVVSLQLGWSKEERRLHRPKDSRQALRSCRTNQRLPDQRSTSPKWCWRNFSSFVEPQCLRLQRVHGPCFCSRKRLSYPSGTAAARHPVKMSDKLTRYVLGRLSEKIYETCADARFQYCHCQQRQGAPARTLRWFSGTCH